MSKIKVTANEDLFNKIELISNMVKNLKGIVQNDMEIDIQDVFIWNNQVSDVQTAIKNVADDVLTHILKDKEPTK